MENSLAIANYFIKKALAEGVDLTPMKLLKLVYIAHGWHLGIEGEPLIGEAVEAWQYGPVIPTVYNAFKKYGNEGIKEPAYIFEGFRIVTPMIENETTKVFLDKIWDVYKKYNGLQLSSLTHQIDTPWDRVWNKEDGKKRASAKIPNNYIQQHYHLKVENNPVIA